MDHKRMQRKKSRGGNDAGALSMLKSSLMGSVCSLVLMLVLALAFSAISYTRDDPDALLGALSFAVLYISAIVAGVITAKRIEKNALAAGALSGIMLVVVLFLISFCFGDTYSSGYSWGVIMGIRASAVAASMLGGFMGSHKRNTRKRKRS